MKEKKIRVIKKKDLELKTRSVPQEKPAPQESAKAIVSNVSSWVNEFQKRKREETKHAFETLLTKQPQNASS